MIDFDDMRDTIGCLIWGSMLIAWPILLIIAVNTNWLGCLRIPVIICLGIPVIWFGIMHGILKLLYINEPDEPTIYHCGLCGKECLLPQIEWLETNIADPLYEGEKAPIYLCHECQIIVQNHKIKAMGDFRKLKNK